MLLEAKQTIQRWLPGNRTSISETGTIGEAFIEEVIPEKQAGFRPFWRCTDQVLALTNFNENGLKNKQVDLKAAY